MGGALGKVIGGALDIFGLQPDTPTTPEAPEAIETGAIAEEGGGETFTDEESENRRKAVRKKRLGTKALQIPLEKTATGAATTTNLGIKV